MAELERNLKSIRCELSPLAQQKMHELLAVLAEEGFGDGGHLPRNTDLCHHRGVQISGQTTRRSYADSFTLFGERSAERHFDVEPNSWRDRFLSA